MVVTMHGPRDPVNVVSTAAGISRGVALVVLGGAGLAAATGRGSGSVLFTLVLVGLVAGIPHGAADHFLLARGSGKPLIMVTGSYALGAAAAWAALNWGGATVLMLVVGLSLLHFALGEIEVNRVTTGWQPGRAVTLAVGVASTGALLLPLARSGTAVQAVASSLAPGFAAALGAGSLRVGLAVLWSGAAVIAVVAALRAGHRMVALDLALMGALGALLPPLAAFAVWFGGWHAVRHTARVLTVEPRCRVLVTDGDTAGAIRHFVRLAALPTSAALAVLMALGAVTISASDPARSIADALRILLALTVPHMLVVLWLDRHTMPRRANPTGLPDRLWATARSDPDLPAR